LVQLGSHSKAHKLTPAMAAGITDKLMEMKDIVALIDDAEMKAVVQKRGHDAFGATIKLRHCRQVVFLDAQFCS
jgi:hypothetical protein